MDANHACWKRRLRRQISGGCRRNSFSTSTQKYATVLPQFCRWSRNRLAGAPAPGVSPGQRYQRPGYMCSLYAFSCGKKTHGAEERFHFREPKNKYDTMITIPIQQNATEYDLWVVLGDENLTRIREYDPAEIVTAKLGMPWRGLRLRNVMICYANTEEIERLVSAPTRAAVLLLIKEVLSRGFKFRPERGDHDGDYQPPRKQ